MLILNNDKDRIIAAWLEKTYGAAAIDAAIMRLAGERRPYVSNVCKVMGVTPPPEISQQVSDAARDAAMKSMRETLARSRGR